MTSVGPFETDGVRGFLHRPDPRQDGGGTVGLVLTHGAGGNCNAPLLVAAATAFSEAGIYVLRCDLPFSQRRPSGPPSPAGAAADRAGLREGDVVIRLAGSRLASFDDLRAALRERRAGDRVDLVFVRNGEQRAVTATLDAVP